jgi:hypothetical protein
MLIGSARFEGKSYCAKREVACENWDKQKGTKSKAVQVVANPGNR